MEDPDPAAPSLLVAVSPSHAQHPGSVCACQPWRLVDAGGRGRQTEGGRGNRGLCLFKIRGGAVGEHWFPWQLKLVTRARESERGWE